MKHLLFGAAAAALLVITPAQAADLGGNCCQDLEERVAELEATAARKGNRKVSVTVYGQVNRAVIFFEDADPITLDNPNSQSRFGFVGKAQISKDVSAGFQIELGLDDQPFNPTVNQVTIRHQFLWLEHANLGRVSIGHTSTAADGITEIDLSNAATVHLLSGLTPIGGSFGMDGARADVVRYDTPILAGFRVSASWSESENWSAALRYGGEFGAIRIAAGIAYQSNQVAAGEQEIISGSASIMHIPTGLFMTGMAGQNKGSGGATVTASFVGFTIPTPFTQVQQYGGRLGIEQKFISVGKTTLFGQYLAAEGDPGTAKIETYGFGLVQSIDAAAMDLYVMGLMVDAGNGLDANAAIAGARIKF